MATTVIPDSQIADLIDQAAQLIHDDGLEIGGYWTDALLRPYEPGMPCCTAGALAAVCGYRETPAVETEFCGIGLYDPDTGVTGADDPHPVLAAVMVELGFKCIEDLYDWSDEGDTREVVEELREVAASIRARGAVTA